MKNGGISYWYADAGTPQRRAPLPSDMEADVCIVGAGFTGLWSAYYLKKARPDCGSRSSSASSPALAPLGATAAGCRDSGRARENATHVRTGETPS